MLPPLQILLVEDNPINQKVASSILQRAGHSVTLATNGIEALHQLKVHDFDLVLMDIQMPVMDGVEATVAIRQNEKLTGQHLPIVALTANAVHLDRDRCLEAGMDGYVTKPVRPPLLFEAMAEALGNQQA